MGRQVVGNRAMAFGAMGNGIQADYPSDLICIVV